MNHSEPLDLLIRGATALTSDSTVPMIGDAAIGIRGDRLVLIGESSAAEGIAARRVIDARGHLATPGFVNVHTHAVLSLARGMTEAALGVDSESLTGALRVYESVGFRAVRRDAI